MLRLDNPAVLLYRGLVIKIENEHVGGMRMLRSECVKARSPDGHEEAHIPRHEAIDVTQLFPGDRAHEFAYFRKPVFHSSDYAQKRRLWQ
jgi:hypothetical protein